MYDLRGAVVGVPDREDFDPAALDGLAAPGIDCAEWGGWVWAVLAGPGTAPPLADWLGSDITTDLGAYRMQDMQLVEKLSPALVESLRRQGFEITGHRLELVGHFRKA